MRLLPLMTLLFSLSGGIFVNAQPVIVSTVPPSGAGGVSPTAGVVFTFSTAMNPDFTEAMFLDSSNPFVPLNTTAAWSAGNTVLTCTPSPAFPAGKFIVWSVDGESASGDTLEGETSGFFTTSAGGGGGGSGTNAITSFSLGKTHTYVQSSAAAPTVDPDFSYSFGALTSLASNRTATAVTLTLPSGSISNLNQNFVQPEDYFLFAIYTNLPAFDSTFSSGNYVFNVQSASSNQIVPLNFPASLQQPAAPRVSNHAAAQNVNPAQPFALTWDAFPGGSAADYIAVHIGDVFSSTNLGESGALKGTATSVSIPAGTFQPNSEYEGTVGFYRYVSTTNGTSYSTSVYRATVTQFVLKTASTVTSPLILTNAVRNAGVLSFDVLCSPGQTVTVRYRTNLANGAWQTLLTTNSPGDRFRVTSPTTPNSSRFFRANDGL